MTVAPPSEAIQLYHSGIKPRMNPDKIIPKSKQKSKTFKLSSPYSWTYSKNASFALFPRMLCGWFSRFL